MSKDNSAKYSQKVSFESKVLLLKPLRLSKPKSLANNEAPSIQAELSITTTQKLSCPSI
jgi:hypothetical protein